MYFSLLQYFTYIDSSNSDRLAIQERYDDVNFDDDIKRDKVKYELADQNKDKKLDKEEFGAFLYPGTVDYCNSNCENDYHSIDLVYDM